MVCGVRPELAVDTRNGSPCYCVKWDGKAFDPDEGNLTRYNRWDEARMSRLGYTPASITMLSVPVEKGHPTTSVASGR